MEILWLSGLISAFTALFGLAMGGMVAFGTKKCGKKFQGGLMGFTGGLLIAFVCFELLPNAFGENRFYSVIIGMLAGIFFIAYLEGKTNQLTGKTKYKGTYKIGTLLALGIAIHNIPEGMAIGSLFAITPIEGIRLCIIIAMHCIPEGLAVCLSVKENKEKSSYLAVLFLFLSLAMGTGGILGAAMSTISPVLVALCFAFAGGVMLYITCGEMIPESKEIWRGRMTTVGSLMGFLLGVAIISGL